MRQRREFFELQGQCKAVTRAVRMPVAKMTANPGITILNIFWYTSNLSTLITAHAKTKKVLMNDEVWTPTVGLVIVDEPRLETTWRIIPVSKWLITMVSKSPKRGYSSYKRPKWLVNRGY